MIDPRNIRRHSQARAVLRFWVSIIIQSILCLVVMLAAVWLLIVLSALLHPPVDLNIQLPTLQAASERQS